MAMIGPSKYSDEKINKYHVT